VPVLAASIAGAGVYIAWQQKRIADVRLTHELYNRRFKVYEAAKTLLVTMQRNGRLSTDDYVTYLRGTSDAVFLLDASVVKYLEELRERVTRLLVLRDQIKENASGEIEYQKRVNESAQIENWFAIQFDILVSRFRPFMRLDEHHRPR